MPAPDLSTFLSLVHGRRGHFALESGYHGGLWLDLDPLFAEPRRIAPFVDRFAEQFRAHEVDVVCGALLGGAFLAQLTAHALGAEFCFTERVMPARGEGLFRASYRLPAGMVKRVRGRRVAIVDDVMSAGSALRGTYVELANHGVTPVVAGALLVLGDVGAAWFAEQRVPVECVVHDEYRLWKPEECPLCESGVKLESL
jgi:orotate phosphoribosyltransferase